MKLRILGLLVLTACPPSPAPVPHDAEGGQLVTPVTACSALAQAGCPSGLDPHCPDVLAHIVDAGLTKIDLACIVNAQSRAAEQACPGSVCP
jgi:hypothetical protein